MLTLVAAKSSDRVTALRLLFSRFPLEEQSTRLQDTLAAADAGRLNLDELLLASWNERPVGAALIMIQSDGIALVWPPVVSCGAENVIAVEDALLNEACRRIDASDARLAQSLLTPDDQAESLLLERHGFVHAADLFFLARTITPEDMTLTIDENTFAASETYDDNKAERFAAVIEQSYLHSLDCVYLKDFRRGVDALESHKLPGVFNPQTWLLFSMGGRDAGVLLLNEHPDQDAIELVYIGVSPEFRGRGLGRKMLAEGVRLAAQRSRAALFLAVDCENHYANALYGELGFGELARRRVMLRHSHALARQ